MGNEACRYEHSNGREQSEGTGVCGPLARQRAAYPVPRDGVPSFARSIGPSWPVLDVFS
jgi:hypothetical protein